MAVRSDTTAGSGRSNDSAPGSAISSTWSCATSGTRPTIWGSFISVASSSYSERVYAMSGRKEKGETRMAHEEQGSLAQSGIWRSTEAEHWQQDVERRRHDFAEATHRMLEAAGLKPGDHVLDIAAGTGDQSLLA